MLGQTISEMESFSTTQQSTTIKRKPVRSRYMSQYETQLRELIAQNAPETTVAGVAGRQETTIRISEVENSINNLTLQALENESSSHPQSLHDARYESIDKSDFVRYRARLNQNNISQMELETRQDNSLVETETRISLPSLEDKPVSVTEYSTSSVALGVETQVFEIISDSESEEQRDAPDTEDAIKDHGSDTDSDASDESDQELEMQLWEHHRREAATYYLQRRWPEFESSIEISLSRYPDIPPKNVEFDKFTWTMRLAEAHWRQENWPSMIKTLQSLAKKSAEQGGATTAIQSALIQTWIADAFMRVGEVTSFQGAERACRKAIKIGRKEQKARPSGHNLDTSALSQRRLVDKVAYGSIRQMILILEMKGEDAEARAYKSLLPPSLDAAEAYNAIIPSYNMDFGKQVQSSLSNYTDPSKDNGQIYEVTNLARTTPVTDLMKHFRLGLREDRHIVEIHEGGIISSQPSADKTDLSDPSMASTLSKIKNAVREAIEIGDLQTIKDIYKDTRVVTVAMTFKDKGHVKSTVLHVAIGNCQFAIARHLLERGFDPNTVDESGANALIAVMLTPVLDQFDYLDLLISKGVNIKHRQRNGSTILHLIAATGDVKSANLVISHGAEVNVKDDDNRTPLYEAVQSNRVEMTNLLLKNGADPSAKNWIANETALDYARDTHLMEIEKTLRMAERGRNRSVFEFFAGKSRRPK